MVVRTSPEDDQLVHTALIVLASWTVLSVPASLVVGRRLAVRPAVVRVRQR